MTRDLEDPLVALNWTNHEEAEGWSSPSATSGGTHNNIAGQQANVTKSIDDDLLLLGDGAPATTQRKPASSDPLLEDDLLGIGPIAATTKPHTLVTQQLSATPAATRPAAITNDEAQRAAVLAATAPLSSTSQQLCVHCGKEIGNLLSTTCDAGLLHNECVADYRKKTTERCAHCSNILRNSRSLIGSAKVHPECANDFKNGKSYVPPRMAGVLKKFAVGRSMLGRKNWQDRFVVVSKALGGIAYFETEADALAYEQGSRVKPPKGVAPLTTATSRLITMPTFKQHPKASSASKEMIVIFHEGEEGKRVERKLLLQFSDWAQRCSWLAVLETYVHVIDELSDYEEK